MRFPKQETPEQIIENIRKEVRKLYAQHNFTTGEVADIVESVHHGVATEIEEPGE